MNFTWLIIVVITVWYLWFFLGEHIKEFFVTMPEVTKEEIRESYATQMCMMADQVREDPELSDKEKDAIISSFVEAHIAFKEELENDTDNAVGDFNKKHKKMLLKLRVKDLLEGFMDMTITLIPATLQLFGYGLVSSIAFIILGVLYVNMFSSRIVGEIGWRHRVSMVVAYMVTQVPYYAVQVVQLGR